MTLWKHIGRVDEMALLYVGLGGFLGSCLRYLLTLLCRNAEGFPLGTLLSNVIAGLLIGFILGMDRETGILSHHGRLFLTTGMMGGLSTFSTFNVETADLFLAGRYAACSFNVLLNLSLSFLGLAVGMAAAKALCKA